MRSLEGLRAVVRGAVGADLALVVEDGSLHDSADAEDGDFRVIDDRAGEQAAEIADRGDGEGAAAQVLQLGLAQAGVGCQAFDLAGNLEQVFVVEHH